MPRPSIITKESILKAAIPIIRRNVLDSRDIDKELGCFSRPKFTFKLVLSFLLLSSVMNNYALAANGNRTHIDERGFEKVYLHLDNTAYFQGETIWYAANVAGQSKVLYVELLSPDGMLLQQQKLKVVDGRADGSILLAKQIKINGKDVNMLYPSGSYQLRAYSRQMLTDGDEVYSCVVPIHRKEDNDMQSAADANTDVPVLSSEPDDESNFAFTSKAEHLRKDENSRTDFAIDEDGTHITDDGLMLDGWVVDQGNHPLEGVTIVAAIGDDKRFALRKVKMTTDRDGYWWLPIDDFFGVCPVCLTLDGKRRKENHSRRIVVRQYMSTDIQPSQQKKYAVFRDKGIEFLSHEKKLNTANYIRYYDCIDEENRRLDLGLPSVSVADLLTEKGLETSVNYADVSYEPNQPINESFYSEPDYGNIDASIGRMEQTDGMRFRNTPPSHVVRGTYVNGHPTRWNIKVPKNFPSKIYDREITYTWETNIKYVKSIFLVDYEPDKHPFVEVRVELRNAEDIGANTPIHRTLPYAGYSMSVEP